VQKGRRKIGKAAPKGAQGVQGLEAEGESSAGGRFEGVADLAQRFCCTREADACQQQVAGSRPMCRYTEQAATQRNLPPAGCGTISACQDSAP
jgi:hypothetical protein